MRLVRVCNFTTFQDIRKSEKFTRLYELCLFACLYAFVIPSFQCKLPLIFVIISEPCKSINYLGFIHVLLINKKDKFMHFVQYLEKTSKHKITLKCKLFSAKTPSVILLSTGINIYTMCWFVDIYSSIITFFFFYLILFFGKDNVSFLRHVLLFCY